MNINDNIIARELEGETVLLNMKNGDYFTLNAMGTEIYNHICGGLEAPEIVDILYSQYDVELDKLEKDVNALIGELRQKDIILDE